MNQQLKTILILVGVVVVAAGSILYGALTPDRPVSTPKPSTTVKNPVATTPSPSHNPKRVDLDALLLSERQTIQGVLYAAYPKAHDDYTLTREQLFDKGEWYGALLTYNNPKSTNRDTLRVLMEKKSNVWILRTKPPQPLLSTKEFPDAPRSVLVTINKAVSLP